MLVFLLLAAAFKSSVTSAPVDIASDPHSPPSSLGILTRDLPECINPSRYRTVLQIVWSCLATIFACTWVALHPNVPSPRHAGWTRLKRKVFMMFLGLIGLELVAIWAMRQRIGAAKHVEEYNKRFQVEKPEKSLWDTIQDWFRDGVKKAGPKPPWTLTHGFLLEMGGLLMTSKEGGEIIVTQVSQLPCPFEMPEEHINDKSKGDFLTKLLVVLQTGWFILQCVARWVTHLPVTELEVVTLAFAFLNIFVYALWWNKPQNMLVSCSFTPSPPAEYDSSRSLAVVLYHEPLPNVVATKVAKILLWPISPFAQLLGYSLIDDNDTPQDPQADMFYSSQHDVIEAGGWVALLLLGLVGLIFGGLHLIPIWLSAFPSPQEKLLWTISALWVTIVPVLLMMVRVMIGAAAAVFKLDASSLTPGVLLHSGFFTDSQSRQQSEQNRTPGGWVLVFAFRFLLPTMLLILSSFCGIFARGSILVLAFTTLRRIPKDGLRNVDWDVFLPHF
ncbi:hypothetical protein AN958_03007 [Leucoagaricus sp. SymC.cos]|nr:hypothetical protein AN958_03007 [Leucoagaricus sp. SymC.cos]